MQGISQKRLYIILGGVAALLLLMVAMTIVASKAKATINIVTSPQDTAITIDGVAVKGSQQVVTKGKHTIAGTRKDFKPTTVNIDASTMDTTQAVYVILEPANTAGQAYIDQNAYEGTIRERASGDDFNTRMNNALDKYPVLSKLPYDASNYYIDYVLVQKAVKFRITVYPYTADKNSQAYKDQVSELNKAALAYLKSEGVDTDHITVEYTEDTSRVSKINVTQDEINNRQ